MNLSKHRRAALILAGIILLGGALLLLFPASEPVEQHAPSPTVSDTSNTTASQPPAVQSDYGGMLLQMVVSVALVCLLAYAILRWGVGRIAGGNEPDGEMEVLGRLGIGPNRSIMVVRVGPRFLVIGNTDTGISLLSELSEEEARSFDARQLTDPQA